MGLMDWLNSFLGRKEENEIKLEPDGVKEFESNEEIQTDIKETLEEPKPEEDAVMEEMKQAKPVKASRAKARSKSRKKGKK
ncbi:MAG: hypothetical protein NTY68_01225 [Candidatus Micrarchaeota archaeon]|nr:hypothetical protein [Candidatus Micrarchaeota archaeon]